MNRGRASGIGAAAGLPWQTRAATMAKCRAAAVAADPVCGCPGFADRSATLGLGSAAVKLPSPSGRGAGGEGGAGCSPTPRRRGRFLPLSLSVSSVDPSLNAAIYTEESQYAAAGIANTSMPVFMAIAWGNGGYATVPIAHSSNVLGFIEFGNVCSSGQVQRQLDMFKSSPWNGRYNTVQLSPPDTASRRRRNLVT